LFGCCIFTGRLHRVGLALAVALLPVTRIIARLVGGDTFVATARPKRMTRTLGGRDSSSGT
jgi:hypothetical protein